MTHMPRRLEQFREPVDERTHARRNTAMTQIRDGYRHGCRPVVWQNLTQAPGVKIRLRERRGGWIRPSPRSPHSRYACSSLICTKPPSGTLTVPPSTLKIKVRRTPGLRAQAIHRDVVSQFVEPQRRALPREIERARTGHMLKRAEPADRQAREPRIRQRSSQDAAIDRFTDQVDVPVADAEREHDPARSARESQRAREARSALADRRRYLDAQPPARPVVGNRLRLAPRCHRYPRGSARNARNRRPPRPSD